MCVRRETCVRACMRAYACVCVLVLVLACGWQSALKPPPSLRTWTRTCACLACTCNQVFGFDTFWVTSMDNYGHEGVVFKGNVRGRDPAVSYQKMKNRLQASGGAQHGACGAAGWGGRLGGWGISGTLGGFWGPGWLAG